MKTLACCALALAPAFVLADEPPASTAQNLDTVVVTGTRTPVPETDALAETFVITRDQIERAQATDVAGLLQQYAGLDVGRSGGPGQQASLFMRGGNSNYTLILIDGVRVNDGAFGSAPLSYLSPENVERIEVVEGPLATLYGSDAITGVINIITRKPGPARLDLEAGGGSFDTVQGAAALRGQGTLDGHAWGAALAVQQEHSGGIPAQAGASEDSGYRNRSISGTADFDLGLVKLEARAWDTGGNSPFLEAYSTCDFTTPAGGFDVCDQRFHDQVLAVQASADPTRNWHSELILSRYLDRLYSVGTGLLRTIRPEADWHNVLGLGEHNRLSFGATASREHVYDVDSVIGEAVDDDYGYVQDELNYGRNHAVAAVNYLHDGAFGERFNWNAQYGYDLLKNTRLIATAGGAFRTPTAEDRFSIFGSNPNLQPETALDYELGVRQIISVHQQAELRLFRTEVRDLVTSLPPDFIPFNIDRARLEGVQADWKYADGPWSAQAGAIAQDPRNLSSGAALEERAKFSANASLERQLGRYHLGASFYTAASRTDFAGPDGGYGLLNFDAGVTLLRGLRLDLSGKNVLNHHYQTVSGYNQPGAAVYAELRYSLPL